MILRKKSNCLISVAEWVVLRVRVNVHQKTNRTIFMIYICPLHAFFLRETHFDAVAYPTLPYPTLPVLLTKAFIFHFGILGLGLDHFSHQNRLEAMQNYLQHPAIFERVNNMMHLTYHSKPHIYTVIYSASQYEANVDKIWLQSRCCESVFSTKHNPQNQVFNFNSILYFNFILPLGCAGLSNESHDK